MFFLFLGEKKNVIWCIDRAFLLIFILHIAPYCSILLHIAPYCSILLLLFFWYAIMDRERSRMGPGAQFMIQG